MDPRRNGVSHVSGKRRRSSASCSDFQHPHKRARVTGTSNSPSRVASIHTPSTHSQAAPFPNTALEVRRSKIDAVIKGFQDANTLLDSLSYQGDLSVTEAHEIHSAIAIGSRKIQQHQHTLNFPPPAWSNSREFTFEPDIKLFDMIEYQDIRPYHRPQSPLINDHQA